MRKRKILFVLLALLVKHTSVFADDGEAAIAAGGIEFKQSKAISMEKEELFLSPEQIRVAFEFKNNEDTDYKTIIAFPLPPTEPYPEESCDTMGSSCSFSKRVGQMAEAFSLRVNGLEKQFQTESKTLENGSTGKTFYWEQVFPAGKTIKIEHSYAPAFGYSYLIDGDARSLVKDYCIDSATTAAIKTLSQKEGKGHLINYREVHYILTSANTWLGPIKDFHLTIEKPKGSLVSLCFDGLKKTGPERFEAKLSNFSPKNELKVLFVEAYNKE